MGGLLCFRLRSLVVSNPYNKQSRHEIPGSRVNKSLHWSHFPGPSPVFPFPCSLEVLHSPWDQSRTWAVGSLLRSSSASPPTTASGLLPVQPHPNWQSRAKQSRAKHSIFRSLSLASCPSPHPIPTPSLPLPPWRFDLQLT